MSSKVEIQRSFLNTLRKKLKGEPGVDMTLWQLSYSYMKFRVCYTNRNELNENKHIDILNQEMDSEIFKLLIDLGFEKKIKIDDNSTDSEIIYVWVCSRDKTRPHGDVKIYAVNFIKNIKYGTDDAGSNWVCFDSGKWELLKWAE